MGMKSKRQSVELFSGCGGLAMGISQAGFGHKLLVERNVQACATLAHNKSIKTKHVKDWPVESRDVREIDWSIWSGSLDLVSGGPPCQPFSIGGKAAGFGDERDMWPEAVRSVRQSKPKMFIFENVKGLLRPKFTDYVEWIKACLANPDGVIKTGESREAHLARLKKNAVKHDAYWVGMALVNAADYGAAQKRHRVIFYGFSKSDFESLPDFPEPTHSAERLAWDKWVDGSYWVRHGLQRPEPAAGSQEEREAKKAEGLKEKPKGKPWRTCRDAFVGLGEPQDQPSVANHKPQPGAKAYPGHTGSPVDEPAKALKAGVHGVPGGENMLLGRDGAVRYFSLRESARLQGFPDDYAFNGSWSESMRQLGNAVPVELAKALGKWAIDRLDEADSPKV